MRDDFQIPNMGTAEDKYDQSFLRRMVRNVEQTFTALRAKGPISVSDLAADNLTLANPLPIASGGTGAPDAATARTNLDAQQQWPNLDAIGPLASAADTVPYFTGSGAAALTPVTPFARTLMDDADAATARATLQMGWKLVYNQSLSGVPNVAIGGLAGARFVRFSYFAVPVSGVETTVNMRLSNDGGSTWDTTATYANAMDYSASGIGSGNNSAYSGPAATTAFLLSAHSAIRPSSNTLMGTRCDYMMTGMSSGYVVVNGNTIMARGSSINDVIVGQQAGWKSYSGMNAFLIYTGTGNMNIDVMVEALF